MTPTQWAAARSASSHGVVDLLAIGTGELSTSLGTTTTDAAGAWRHTSADLATGMTVYGTVTDSDGNTSAFCSPLTVP